MGIIITIILGGIIGWLAGKVFHVDLGVVASIVVGLIGSLIGSFISNALTGADRSYLAFSWGGLFWAFIGSVAFILVIRLITGRKAL